MLGLNVIVYQSRLLQRCHPACGHLRIFSSLPGSRLVIFYRDDASSPLSQLVNQYGLILFSHVLTFPLRKKP